MPPAVWAASDLPIRALAVVGAFTVGGLVVGGLFALVARAVRQKPLPARVSWLVRLLGGVACGWLVAYLVLSGSGGFGGPGGGWFGGSGGADNNGADARPGKQKGKAPDETPVVTPRPKDKETSPGAGSGAGDLLRVEVLGDEPLRKLAGGQKVDAERRYRLPDDGGKLLTLPRLKELIRERRKASPPLRRLLIVTYLDSPDTDTPPVKDLQKFANDFEETEAGKLEVGLDAPGHKAPVK